VSGSAASEDADQAIALTEAAKRVMPGSPLDLGGEIRLLPAINDLCYPGVPTTYVITGCLAKGGIYVRWPLGTCADLTCSALPHELCHIGQGYKTREDTADACALLVVKDYRGHVFDGRGFE
jgi:hypothetical protein